MNLEIPPARLFFICIDSDTGKILSSVSISKICKLFKSENGKKLLLKKGIQRFKKDLNIDE